MLNQNLQNILDGVIQLPTLPQVVTRLIHIVDNPETTAAEVSQLIASDQSFMVKVLKLVNSPFYGMSKQISTLSQATVILGFAALRNLALTTAIFDEFLSKESGNEVIGFTREKFWEHSIATGVAAKALAPYVGYNDPEDAFIAGLIHDIGKVIFDQFVHEDFVAALTLAEVRGGSLYEAEKEVIGESHAFVGGWLAESWNIPENLQLAIRYHHQPFEVFENEQLPAIIALANGLSLKGQFGFSGDYNACPVDDQLLQRLNISNDDLASIEEQIEENVSEMLGFFSATF